MGAQGKFLSLHRYGIAVKIDAEVGIFDHLPVDGDRTFADECFDLAAGQTALHGDGLVQPLFLCHCCSPYLSQDDFSFYCTTRDRKGKGN